MLKFLVCYLMIVVFWSLGHGLSADFHGSVTQGQVGEALNNTPHVRVIPPNPLYSLIKLKELFSRFFTSSASERASFDFMISGKRLKESHSLFWASNDKIEETIRDYGSSLQNSIKQLEKARSQNQEILPTVDMIVADLNYHEVLIISMASEDSSKVEPAVKSFESFVSELDKFKPGVKTRFRLLRDDPSEQKTTIEDRPIPNPTQFNFEPTESSKPRRIIY